MIVRRSILSAGISAAVVVASPPGATLSPSPVLFVDSLNCNLSQYKAAEGLTAAVEQGTLAVSWTGQNRADLRARYVIDSGQPVVRDLAVKKEGGQWTTLGKNLTPEYHVVRRFNLEASVPVTGFRGARAIIRGGYSCRQA